MVARVDVSRVLFVSVIRPKLHQRFFSGGHREEETPDPIPNSAVKLFIADGTAHKSVGE